MARQLREIERVEFNLENPAPVIAWMARLRDAADGWINLVPKIAEEEERPTSLGFFTLFGGGGSGVTMCTWVPGGRDHGGHGQPSIGIAHGTGRRAAPQLDALAVAIPIGWLVEQDHPRRGLVLRVPFDLPDEQLLAWALRAVGALTPPHPITGWHADIYRPLVS